MKERVHQMHGKIKTIGGPNLCRILIRLSVIAVCAASLSAQSSVLTMTTNWTSRSSGGGVSMASNTIHNYSSVPLTAWLIVSKVKHKVDWFDMGYTTKDTLLLSAYKEIAPGADGIAQSPISGDPTNLEFRLVAGVFADGSTYGDTEWAQYIIGRRRNVYQVSESAISDLFSLRAIPQSTWVSVLSSSKERQLTTAKGQQNDTGTAARRLVGTAKRKTFEEDSLALKNANVDDAIASDLVGAIGSTYDALIKWVDASEPTPPAAKRLDLAISSYQDKVRRLTESRPALFANSRANGSARPKQQ